LENCRNIAYNLKYEYYKCDRYFSQESDDEDRKTREKQERIEASIRKREEEVKKDLSSSLREREKEREQHKRDEAVQLFNALLVDLVGVCVLDVIVHHIEN